eukprot:gene15484-399_t
MLNTAAAGSAAFAPLAAASALQLRAAYLAFYLPYIAASAAAQTAMQAPHFTADVTAAAARAACD